MRVSEIDSPTSVEIYGVTSPSARAPALTVPRVAGAGAVVVRRHVRPRTGQLDAVPGENSQRGGRLHRPAAVGLHVAGTGDDAGDQDAAGRHQLRSATSGLRSLLWLGLTL